MGSCGKAHTRLLRVNNDSTYPLSTTSFLLYSLSLTHTRTCTPKHTHTQTRTHTQEMELVVYRRWCLWHFNVEVECFSILQSCLLCFFQHIAPNRIYVLHQYVNQDKDACRFHFLFLAAAYTQWPHGRMTHVITKTYLCTQSSILPLFETDFFWKLKWWNLKYTSHL